MGTKKVKEEKLNLRFEGFRDRGCCMNIRLDKRTNRKNVGAYPLVARFTFGKDCFYKKLGGSFTEEEFSAICNAKKSDSPEYEERMRWDSLREKYKNIIRDINPGGAITRRMVEAALSEDGRKKEDGKKETFISLWEDITNEYLNSDKYSTGEFYYRTLESFKLIVGEKSVVGFDISIDHIKKWKDGMTNGVDKDVDILFTKILSGKEKGKVMEILLLTPNNLSDAKDAVIANETHPSQKHAKRKKWIGHGVRSVGKVSTTTMGIYLRTFRAVWNAITKKGYLRNIPYPFDKREDDTHISMPRGDTRKGCFVDTEKMTELYNFFIEAKKPEKWTDAFWNNAYKSLGLFLVQYLCNGFNLADAAALRYKKYYFATNGRAFIFNRRKTAERSDDGSEVIIPIIPPLQAILDRIAAKPEHVDDLVFPFILNGCDPNDKINFRKIVKDENGHINKRVRRITKDILGWPMDVSNTWMRHSYATNLRNAGVDLHYIDESIGHSTQKSVTEIYLASFPLDKQFENNSKLLNLKQEKEPANMPDITSMTNEQLMQYMDRLKTEMALRKNLEEAQQT